MRNRNDNYRLHDKFMRDKTTCELCGADGNLELHHIIPMVFDDYLKDGESLDSEDNFIAVCELCHKKLTRRKVLQSAGIEKAHFKDKIYNEIYRLFYENMQRANDAYANVGHGWLDVSEAIDVFDETLEEVFNGKKVEHKMHSISAI